jgi:hypothetical protein
MPWSTSQQVAYERSEQQFQLYKVASNMHEGAQTARSELGDSRADSTVEHLSAIHEADAALNTTSRALDVARAAYLCEPAPATWRR